MDSLVPEKFSEQLGGVVGWDAGLEAKGAQIFRESRLSFEHDTDDMVLKRSRCNTRPIAGLRGVDEGWRFEDHSRFGSESRHDIK